jgi:prolyl oligopeptidase
VKTWIAEQNRVTEQTLTGIAGYDALRARVEQLLVVGDVSRPFVSKTERGFRYFYTRRSGRQDQPFLLVRSTPQGPDTIVVDPNSMSSSGDVALDYFHPSPDGKLVAYGTSEAGSEWSTLRIRDVDGGRDLVDTIERARNAGVCWEPNGKAFYYARYPQKDTVPADEAVYHRRIHRHVLGTPPSSDELVFGDGREMTDYPTCALSPDGRWLAVTVFQGWSKSEIFVADTTRRPLSFARATEEGAKHLYSPIVRNDSVFVVTDDGAERFRVMAFRAGTPERKAWTEVIPEHRTDVLEDVTDVGDELCVG